MTIEERPRGILSPADRKYLKNPKAYSDQAAYERRQAIITRVYEALHDFPVLLSQLEAEHRREAFRDYEGTVPSSPFAFLYLGITDTVEPEELAKDAFEGAVADGVRKAYLKQGVSVDEVEVTVEVDTGPSIEELKREENMDQDTILELFRLGEISSEEMKEYIEFVSFDDS